MDFAMDDFQIFKTLDDIGCSGVKTVRLTCARYLRERRQKLGMSIEEASALSGVPPAEIEALESPRRKSGISFTIMLKLLNSYPAE